MNERRAMRNLKGEIKSKQGRDNTQLQFGGSLQMGFWESRELGKIMLNNNRFSICKTEAK
jgi:hypothetical protein